MLRLKLQQKYEFKKYAPQKAGRKKYINSTHFLQMTIF